jgi:hypothetical protein
VACRLFLLGPCTQLQNHTALFPITRFPCLARSSISTHPCPVSSLLDTPLPLPQCNHSHTARSLLSFSELFPTPVNSNWRTAPTDRNQPLPRTHCTTATASLPDATPSTLITRITNVIPLEIRIIHTATYPCNARQTSRHPRLTSPCSALSSTLVTLLHPPPGHSACFCSDLAPRTQPHSSRPCTFLSSNNHAAR